MKRMLTILLTAALLLTGSCFAGAETARKVGICLRQDESGFSQQMGEALTAYFGAMETDEISYELFITDADSSAETQEKQIKNLVAQGVQAVILDLADENIVVNLWEKLRAAKVAVVIVGREPTVQTMFGSVIYNAYSSLLFESGICYVGDDIRQAGLLQGEILAAQPNSGDLNEDGKLTYALLRGSTGDMEAKLRTEWSLRAVEEAGLELDCLSDDTTDGTRKKAKKAAADLLRRYAGKLDVIICSSDTLALGAANAIEDAGLQAGQDVYLLGIDGLDEAVQKVRENKMTGTVAVASLPQFMAAADAAIRAMNGEELSGYVWTSSKYTKIMNAVSPTPAPTAAPEREAEE